MEVVSNKLTIEDIEKKESVNYESNSSSAYPLEVWYRDVRKKRLSDLTDGDIARFVRQKMYLGYIVPEAIKRVLDNPTIGDTYYGEILTSLYQINDTFWEENKNCGREMIMLLDKLLAGNLIAYDFEWSYEDEATEFYAKASSFYEKLKRLEV